MVDKEILMKERDAKKLQETEKLRKKNELTALQAAKDAHKKINPKEMFLNEIDKYSAFDDNVSIFIL